MGSNQERAITVRANQALARFEDATGELIAPAVSIHETEDAFLVSADMPGAARDTIKVWAKAGSLTLRATVAQEEVAGTKSKIRTYVREFVLTDGIDHANATAHFEDGVLTVRLPKTEGSQRRDIPIK